MKSNLTGLLYINVDQCVCVDKYESRDRVRGDLSGLREPLFVEAEDTSAWPEHLKRKMERGEAAREEEEMG